LHHHLPEDDKHSTKPVGEIIFAITCKIVHIIFAFVGLCNEI